MEKMIFMAGTFWHNEGGLKSLAKDTRCHFIKCFIADDNIISSVSLRTPVTNMCCRSHFLACGV
jgi:hypothetical protein